LQEIGFAKGIALKNGITDITPKGLKGRHAVILLILKKGGIQRRQRISRLGERKQNEVRGTKMLIPNKGGKRLWMQNLAEKSFRLV
jgi:hypothetical protein